MFCLLESSWSAQHTHTCTSAGKLEDGGAGLTLRPQVLCVCVGQVAGMGEIKIAPKTFLARPLMVPGDLNPLIVFLLCGIFAQVVNGHSNNSAVREAAGRTL